MRSQAGSGYYAFGLIETKLDRPQTGTAKTPRLFRKMGPQ